MVQNEYSIKGQFEHPTDTILDSKSGVDPNDQVKKVDNKIEPDPPVKKVSSNTAPDGEEKLDELYEQLGGKSLDENGNLVDASGKIIKTALEVEAAIKKKKDNSDTATEEEEEQLSVDEDGNLVNAEGEIVHEKGTFTVDEKTGEVSFNEDPFVETLAKNFREEGYKLLDETGKPLTFEDSEEGTRKLVEAIATEAYNATWNKLYDQYPVVEKMMAHLQAGRDPQDFFRLYSEKVDYSKINVPEENTEGRKAVIAEYLSVVANNDKDTIDILLKTFEDSGEIDAKYNDYLAKLKDYQKKTDEIESARIAQEAADLAKSQQQYWSQVKEAITKGKLDNIVIPETDRNLFYDYVARRTEKGTTKAAEDYQALPLEKQLQLDYLLFKGFDLDKLVKARVNQEKVDAFKARSQKAKPVIVKKSAQYRREDNDGKFTTKTVS